MFRQIPLVERPSHVPPERVRDFDIYDVNVTNGDWQLHLRDLLQGPGMPDVFWTPRNTGHWVAARAKTAKEVLSNSDNFSSNKIIVIKEMNPKPPFAPLQIDPPDHKIYRDLLAPALAPNVLNAMREKARTLSIELIEGFKPRGECEFVGEFATWLPIAIFMTMTDLPEEDRPALLKIADTIVRPQSGEEHVEANLKLRAYAQQKIDERRAQPGEDMISRLTQAQVKGQPLDDATLMGMLTLLLTAGLDTVASMLGFFARYLADHPELRHELAAKPERTKHAVEELLRRHPIANLAREVRRDCTLDGVELRAGEMILVPTVSYGLDDRQFERPEAVDIDRKNKIHETFGDGPHRCMGSMLARVELEVFIDEWLKRIPDFSVKPGVPIHVTSASVAGIRHLPLVWSV